jgi:hypothetical protein
MTSKAFPRPNEKYFHAPLSTLTLEQRSNF